MLYRRISIKMEAGVQGCIQLVSECLRTYYRTESFQEHYGLTWVVANAVSAFQTKLSTGSSASDLQLVLKYLVWYTKIDMIE